MDKEVQGHTGLQTGGVTHLTDQGTNADPAAGPVSEAWHTARLYLVVPPSSSRCITYGPSMQACQSPCPQVTDSVEQQPCHQHRLATVGTPFQGHSKLRFVCKLNVTILSICVFQCNSLVGLLDVAELWVRKFSPSVRVAWTFRLSQRGASGPTCAAYTANMQLEPTHKYCL